MSFLETAARIGARICRDAIWWSGECNWIAAQQGGHHEALSPRLYGGTSGIAWFLLHLFDATGDKVFRITGEAALRQAINHSGALTSEVGFHTGLAGIAWVAARKDLLADLEPVASRIDATDGSAGAIAVLISAGLLEQAVRHGEFLIRAARRSEAGWSWKTTSMHDAHLTGFAHGAAGIAWALLELFRATGDVRFREAALHAFRYEESLFVAEDENWPDLRTGLGRMMPRCMVAWCHGAPGIGLSRLRAYEILGDETFRTQAETAIRTTARSLESLDNYSLCHGAGGNAELLLCAARAMENPEYAAPAYGIAEKGIHLYERERAPWPCGDHGEGETPGLMVGTAGIGYFLLRLSDLERFPSILLPRLPYSGASGFTIVRHIWAVGLLSFPSPSFGCLKCRPMISVNFAASTM